MKCFVQKAISLLVTVVLLSCSNNIKDDQQLLELLLKDGSYKKEDSVSLMDKSFNKSIILFFNKRNTIEETFSFANKDGSKPIIKDSSSVSYDTVIYKPLRITSNEYLSKGKGIDKKAEIFLKDSFNYKMDSITWNFKEKLFNVYLEGAINKPLNKLNIGKPVYNSNRTKAILSKIIF